MPRILHRLPFYDAVSSVEVQGTTYRVLPLQLIVRRPCAAPSIISRLAAAFALCAGSQRQGDGSRPLSFRTPISVERSPAGSQLRDGVYAGAVCSGDVELAASRARR